MDNLPRSIAFIFYSLTALTAGAWLADSMNLINVGPDAFEPLLAILGVMSGVATLVWRRDDTPSPERRSNRQILIDIVRNNWIEGVLNDALRDAEIDIAVDVRPEQAGRSDLFIDYDLPVEIVRRHERQVQRIPLNKTPDVLLQLFKEVDRQLLILGAPGSGKTVLLLQLAQRLLDEAEANQQENAVPVVFNLSSWAVKREPFKEWLVAELNRNYGISKKLADEWIKGDALIYLLDGLDEVAAEYRNQCLQAINHFMGRGRQVVVCSRLGEYRELSEKLDARNAIEVKPLGKAQVEQILNRHLPDAETSAQIFAMLQTVDPAWQEVNKPLFVNVLVKTYRDGRRFAAQSLQGDTTRQIQSAVIEPYLTRQLQNQSAHYDNADSNRYLAWIGWNLRRREQTVFYVEMLQADWHPLKDFEYQSLWIVGLVYGLLNGFVVGLGFLLVFGLTAGLIFGVMAGLYSISLLDSPSRIDLQRKLSLDLTILIDFFKDLSIWRDVLFSALFMGLFFGLLSGLSSALLSGLSRGLQIGLVFGVGGLLSGGIMGVLFLGSEEIIEGLSEQTSITQRKYLNQGLRDTFRLSLLVGISVGSVVGLIGWVVFGSFVGLSGSLFFGLLFALLFGFDNFIRHISIRYLFHRDGLAPRRYDRFLMHVIERRIMRRVGGSAIFIHRYILDYYADEWQREYADPYS